MRPADFIAKWSDSRLRERQGSQEHFIDLCRLLGEPTPAEDDPRGERYCFERGAGKVGGGDGWADVWRRGCFGWEYKGRHKNLNAALRQLQAYALDLENPPYLVVSDMERIIVHTNWTNTVSQQHEFGFEDFRDAGKLEMLRQVFRGSEKLKPGISPQELTAKAATRFGELGRRLQDRGHPPRAVAHFLNKLIFCMFAEDADLLPKGLFTRTVKATLRRPELAEKQLCELFSKMATKDDRFFGAEFVRWFNGGLFADGDTLPLELMDLKVIAELAEAHEWDEIDPAIFGTLFEQALKATRERPTLGAHYTDRQKIMKIVEPVIVRPLAAEWDAAKARIEVALGDAQAAEAERRALLERAAEALRDGREAAMKGEAARRKDLDRIAKRRTAALTLARDILEAHLARLGAFRVLDPACGSGNFLYVALHALMDLERRALVDAERLALAAPAPRVGLQAVKGIEIEPYAAELARLTLWIGYLQWMRRNEAGGIEDPVLSKLDQIENRDALLNLDGTEAQWPPADAIIGNPPFAGDKKQHEFLGDKLAVLRACYKNRVPASANLVGYWFYKAGREIFASRSKRFGLVATQAIRRGNTNLIIRDLVNSAPIFDAWSNETWILDGAAIRVSLICAGNDSSMRPRVDGVEVEYINADLTSDTAHELPKRLQQNSKIAFQGTISGGPFEVEAELARHFYLEPLNPNGRPNSDVLRPWMNADDIVDRRAGYWIIDFGDKYSCKEASLYEAPFQWLEAAWAKETQRRNDVGERPLREREPRSRNFWWRLQRRRSSSIERTIFLPRYTATPRVSKYRIFVWMHPKTIPDTRSCGQT